jgi:NADH-quinone oxidoreductase subunit K
MDISLLFPATVPLGHYLVLSLLLFGIGLYGIVARRNAIAMLLSIELMLNAVAINFVAFARSGLLRGLGASHIQEQVRAQAEGQIFVVFLVTVAVAEAAVGLAIILALFRIRRTTNADEINLLRG